MTLRKTISLVLIGTALQVTSYAQAWTTSGTNLVTSPGSTTNVGINVSTPVDKLTVNGDITLTKDGDDSPRLIWGRTNTGFLGMIAGGAPYTNGSMLLMYGANNAGSDPGSIGLYAAGTPGNAFNFFSNTGSGYQPVLNINRSGDLLMVRNGDGDYRRIQGTSTNYGLKLAAKNSFIDGSAIHLYGTGNTNNPGQVQLISNGAASTATGFLFTNSDAAGGLTNLMSIRKDGKVVIGSNITLLPNSYALFVEKGILTEKVKVAINNSSNWADFVFADDYALTPLAQLENYIREHKHLPEVPSAEQVVAEGVDLGEMNARLLQKVEELTLYVIQQQKEINALKHTSKGHK